MWNSLLRIGAMSALVASIATTGSSSRRQSPADASRTVGVIRVLQRRLHALEHQKSCHQSMGGDQHRYRRSCRGPLEGQARVCRCRPGRRHPQHDHRQMRLCRRRLLHHAGARRDSSLHAAVCNRRQLGCSFRQTQPRRRSRTWTSQAKTIGGALRQVSRRPWPSACSSRRR